MEPWLKQLIQFLLKSGGTFNLVPVAITDGDFLSSAPNRIGIIINPPSTNRFTITHNGPAVLDQGLTIVPNSPIVFLNLLNAGGLVTKPWRGISAGVAQNVQVHEVIGPFV